VSLDIYLRLRAARVGRGQPRATRRHVHLAVRPLVLVGYHLAGDPGAPVALRYGSTPDWSQTVVVPDPRDRDLRLAQLADFAGDLVRYLDRFIEREPAEPAEEDRAGGQTGRLCAAAPQLVCPNQSTAAWLTERLCRLLHCPPTDADQPADPVLAQAAAHLGYLAGRRGLPGSSAVLTASEVLTTHWVTGQLPAEDAHLGAVLAWIEPPDGMRGPEAAVEAELGPTAGPVSDPGWDREVLQPLVGEFSRARRDGVPDRSAAMELVAACTEALAPAWRHTWQALELLRELPEAAHLVERWDDDRRAWTRHRDRLEAGQTGAPQRLDQVRSFRLLHQVEARTAIVARQMAVDDPLLMAGRVAAGEAVAGEVVARDCANRVTALDGASLLRPVLWVRPVVPFDRPVGTVLVKADDTRVGVRVESVSGNGTVELLVVTGAGPDQERAEENLPGPGERMTLIGGGDEWFPSEPPGRLPWTHEPAGAGAEER
jgi:hypothetical protein